MSTAHAVADRRAGRDARRKRKQQGVAPAREPKRSVDGAGQPLDPSIRRELEERLGHDLGRVRLHTDRDAATLTGLLGADAVAVGQDVFFAEGGYQPGTTAGRRLLAHELLHTVQAPYGLGALTAGRDNGAVSMPQQAAERAAEDAARSAADGGSVPEPGGEAVTNAVRPAQTPGWMRYATASAGRLRGDRLDPATVPDRLAAEVVRSLRGDPTDASGRVRMRLARLAPELRASVLARLRTRLFSSEYDRLLELESAASVLPYGFQPAEAPAEVPDAVSLAAEDYQARVGELKAEAGTRAQREKEAGEEKKVARDRDAAQAAQQSQAQRDVATENTDLAQRTVTEDTRAAESEQDAAAQQQQDDQRAAERQDADQQDTERAEKEKDDSDQTADAREEQREREEADPEQATEPGADKRNKQDEEQRPPDGPGPQPVDPKKADTPGPIRSEKVDERAEMRDSPLVRHGLDEKDEDSGEPREEELPIGAEAAADLDIGEAQFGTSKGGAVHGEIVIKPEDYLPDTDLDVSAVPTAGQIQVGEGGDAQPAMPAFPAPPPTKAEQLEAQREENASADEEEGDDAPEAEAKAPGEEQGPVEGEAPKPEGGPAAEAADRTEHDLQPDKPADQEIGPDPATEDRPEREQRAERHRDPEHQQDLDADGNEKDKRTERDRETERDDSGDGTGAPDAQHTQDEETERKDADTRQEQRDAKGYPDGDAADKPSGDKPSGIAGEGDAAADTAVSTAARPAGAHTEPTPAPDRNPSPAAARVAEDVRPDDEAAGPKSAVRKETGQDGEPSAPEGQVGGSEPAHAPSSAAGPGGAPSAGSAAVSPAGEQGTQAPGQAQAPGAAQPAQDASLEKDGGGCAPPAPPPEPAENKCSAGGGDQHAPEQKKPKPPDVSQQEPTTALATVSKLPPDEAQAALPGVDGAANHKVTTEHKRLVASPPRRERPSGAPQTQAGPPPSQPPAPQVTGRLERVGPEPEGKKQQAQGGPKAAGAQPAANVPVPSVTGNKNGQVDASDVQNVQQAANNVPTTDPQLDNKTVGPAPKIRLEGASDPRRTDKQVTKLRQKEGDLQDTGRADASKNLGEDKIFPNVPREQLTGSITGGAPAGGVEKAGPEPKPGYGVVAQQERGPQINAGASQAQAQMVSGEKKQQQDEQRDKQQKQQQIDAEVQRNADAQAKERGQAADDAKNQRTQWRDEQDAKIKEANDKSAKEHTDSNQKIVSRRDDNDKKLSDRKDTDDKRIDDERKKAEADARKKKEEKQHHSGGLLGGLISSVTDFFKGLLKAVTDIFNAARKLVNGIIDTFKKWADGIINAVRDFVVAAINALADVLIALADVLLAAFPSLRDKFRKAIESLRDKAIAAVNKLADELKAAVSKLLDALGAALNALLKVLETALKAAINIYRAAIVGALQFVQRAAALLGQFAALIADIAPDPGGWVSKAASAMKTGITDYLWAAIKTAVKTWFDEKVQSILGLGKLIIDILIKGCLSLKQIAKMAWDAVIAALPMIIVSIVIEKIVSLIVPAAGAILTIIQSIVAAWGTISRILAAFGAFFNFLKAVRAGPAACLFAEFVAAGVVAVLEFITNFLLQRLGRALKPVGARLKTLAQKIMQGLKKVAKGTRKVAGRVINGARGAARKAAQALRKPEHPGKPVSAHVPSRPKVTADHTHPGGPRRPPRRVDQDRPPSRVPDRAKEHRGEESAAKQERDREKERAGAPPRRPGERPPEERAPGERRPEEERAPGERPPSERRPEEGGSGKKPKETEAPKRERPREPKSRVGRALARAKNGVKGALTKVRNALKALGRKLRKSKLGRALERTAKKIRDFFKRKRDQLRERWRRRKEERRKKREERKKKEGKDSKETRLAKIVSRIQPKIDKLLSVGVLRPALQGVLGGLRLWYRLTKLELKEGGDAFSFLAFLNPSRGFGKDYWDKFSRVGEDSIRRFNENAERTRKFSTPEQNRNARRYGQIEMGYHMNELPSDERRAVLEYSDFGPVYNNLLRANEDPNDMLETLRTRSGWRETLQRIMGPSGSGRRGRYTPEDLQARLGDPTLDDFDRNVLRGILDVGAPGGTPEQVQSKQRREIARSMRPMPSSRREQIALSFGRVLGKRPGPVTRIPRFPTPDEVLNRSVLIDQATRRYKLAEGLETHRTLESISFMTDDNKSDPDPRELVGSEQREHGFMSTSLGGESIFSALPYRLRISVPKGSPALWVGRNSRYPHQRELILPSNTLYVITDVTPATGGGPWTIFAEIQRP